MMPASAGSASKISEQEGSMINSSSAMCTGSSNSGHPGISTGTIDRPAIGTCTATMNVMALRMLS
jgi:hypothetical protein